MKSQKFDLKGNRIGIPHRSASNQHGEGAHLFSPSGFLDDAYWHRSYWVYGRGFDGGHGGYYVAGKFAPAGRILTFDDKTVYGFGRKAKYYRWTTPIEHHLFADDKNTPRSTRTASRRGARSESGPWVSVTNSPSLNPADKPLAVEAWVNAEKGDGVVIARGGPANGYALVIKGGQPRFALRTANKLSTVTAKQKIVGKWTHVAGVLTKDRKLKIYVDGKLAGTAEATGLIAGDPVQGTEIGADAVGSVGDYQYPSRFTGTIDEVRVYFGEVSDAEIEKHSTTPGKAEVKDAKLVLCLTFDKNASDASGNANHGKIGGGRTVKGRFGQAIKFPARKSGGAKKKRRQAGGSFKHLWAQDLPFIVRAMVLADKTLFVAGLPDVVDEDIARSSMDTEAILKKLDRQDAAWQGRKGAVLWAVSAGDGKKLAEYKLDIPPIFDGMIAAGGRLYIVTMDGKVLCMGARK